MITSDYGMISPDLGTQQNRKVLFMQKLNFVLAFALAFFAGCTDTAEDAVDCGCAAPVAAAVEAAEAPAAEVAPAAPAAEAVMSEAPVVEAAPVVAPAAPVAAPVVVESH